MSVHSGPFNGCAILRNVPYASAQTMRSLHFGNSIRKRHQNLMMTCLDIHYKARKRIVPRAWMSGALRRKTIAKPYT